MELTYEQALSRAEALCARSEKCAADIMRKGFEWGLERDDAERLVEHLRKEKFIDDARYVRAFTHDKHEYQHWGRVKIKCALLQKGFSSSLISDTLDEVIGEEEYDDTLVALLRAKMRGMSLPLDVKNRAKLYRFGAQRGYEAGKISQALRQLQAADDDEFED